MKLEPGVAVRIKGDRHTWTLDRLVEFRGREYASCYRSGRIGRVVRRSLVTLAPVKP